MDFNKWNIFWTASFGIVALVIITGNTLSILILLKRSLRKRPHFLLISLAVADLLVGLCAIPIYMTTMMSGQKLTSKFAFDLVDMSTGFASIFTLAVISIERVNAIVRPLRHRQLGPRSYLVAIVTPWVLSLSVASTRALLEFALLTIQQFLGIVIVSLSAPLLISCLAYCLIWKANRGRFVNNFRQKREAQFSKTVLLITGTFFLTWMPFQVLVIVLIKCLSCRNVSASVILGFKLLHFSNSFVNFFIYCYRLPIYRRTFLSFFLSCRFDHERNRIIVLPGPENQTSSIILASASRIQSSQNGSSFRSTRNSTKARKSFHSRDQ